MTTDSFGTKSLNIINDFLFEFKIYSNENKGIAEHGEIIDRHFHFMISEI